jgi:hypothetical protein
LIERPAASDTSRRVPLVTPTPVAFKSASHPTITTMEIEPVSGIGDEAFYQLDPSDCPFIWVRKDNVAVSIRILTGSRAEVNGRGGGRTCRWKNGADRWGPRDWRDADLMCSTVERDYLRGYEPELGSDRN